VEKKNIYELFCDFSYNLIRFKFSNEYLEKEERILKFCDLKIQPTSNISASFIFFLLATLFSLLLSIIINFAIFPYLLIISLFLSFLIYYFPYLLMRYIRITSSSEMTLCITYMVISLSRVPNLENAIVFTFKNLRGPLRKDFERIILDFSLRRIFSMEEGLRRVVEKWSFEAKEFSEALQLLMEYAKYPHRGEKLLDEAIRLTVDDSYNKMMKYARELKLPTTAILVLGIILPVIGLTLIPLITIFLPELLNISMVFFVYDFFLPLILFSIIIMLVEGRPMTASTIITNFNPLAINIGGKKINLLLLIFFLILPLLAYLIIGVSKDVAIYSACSGWAKSGFEQSKKPDIDVSVDECKFYLTDLLYQSVKPSLILLIFTFAIFIPLYLRNRVNVRETEKVKKVEGAFSTLLFQLAHKTRGGTPIEEAIFSLSEKGQNVEVENMIKELKKSLSLFGSVREALLGVRGVINKYNSTIIRSVFEIIAEISSRGSLYVSQTLSTFSRHLHNLSSLQEKIEDLISDNVSTLKFMSYFLTPIVGGVSVSIGMIILAILGNLSVSLQNIIPKESGLPSVGLPMIDLWNASSIPPSLFQLAIGIYVLELCLISSFFIVGLENGFNSTYLIDNACRIVVVSLLLFITVSLIVYAFLSGLVISLFVVGE